MQRFGVAEQFCGVGGLARIGPFGGDNKSEVQTAWLEWNATRLLLIPNKLHISHSFKSCFCARCTHVETIRYLQPR